MVLIRPATPDDCEGIMVVHVGAIIDDGPTAYDPRQVAAWAAKTEGVDRYEEAMADPATDLLVAERDASVAGFAQLDRANEEVEALFVAPRHGSEGVGTALLEECESRLREMDAEESPLRVARNAVGFYEQAGYEQVGRESTATTAGVELETVRMRKRLD